MIMELFRSGLRRNLAELMVFLCRFLNTYFFQGTRRTPGCPEPAAPAPPAPGPLPLSLPSGVSPEPSSPVPEGLWTLRRPGWGYYHVPSWRLPELVPDSLAKAVPWPGSSLPARRDPPPTLCAHRGRGEARDARGLGTAGREGSRQPDTDGSGPSAWAGKGRTRRRKAAEEWASGLAGGWVGEAAASWFRLRSPSRG